MKKARRSAFTLIELLIVVAVIGILAGIMLRLGNLVYQKIARAKEARRIEHLRLCLEEYYKAYGEYPRTSGMSYVSPLDGKFPSNWGQISRAISRQAPQWNAANSTGLIWFVMSDGAEFTTNHAPENTAWREYWKQVGYVSDWVPFTNRNSATWGVSYGHFSYSNIWYSVYDSWRREYRYVSKPPYQSYRLWSAGPDGKTWDPDLSDSQNRDRVADDVGFESWVE